MASGPLRLKLASESQSERFDPSSRVKSVPVKQILEPIGLSGQTPNGALKLTLAVVIRFGTPIRLSTARPAERWCQPSLP